MSVPPSSLWRATLTLLAGSALAQALPLLLGPLITRLYGPQTFGHYTAFATVAANLAVVACARYEFALPLARDEAQAESLLALCLRVLLGVTLLAAVIGAVLAAWGVLAGAAWLPAAVAALGAAQLFTLWANRLQRFRALAASRVLQHGGGAAAQVALGWGTAGALGGLVWGPILSATATAALLLPRDAALLRRLAALPATAVKAVAREFREFPLLNTPHAFAGALQDTLAVVLIAWWAGDAAVGFWGLALRYLKAPATLVGSAVSQALYPRLAQSDAAAARAAVVGVMKLLGAVAVVLMAVLMAYGPALAQWLFGDDWRSAGELARALAPYIAMHFVASPLAVVTMAWRAQAWALRLSLVGQAVFLLALAGGLAWGGLQAAGWCVSAAMSLYFAWYFWKLATWKEVPDGARA